MSGHVFCREVCLKRGEPLAGTGQVASRVLLLRWPRGKWRVPRFESAGMSPQLGTAIEAAMKSGIHVALVDRQGETSDIPMLQAQPEGLKADFASEADLVDAINSYAAGGELKGVPEPRPTILCCTDSRRDACCARFGFATFKALKEKADPERFQLLQCTHIGGCRFAASIMVLPQRQRYGRLSAEEVPAFLEAIREEKVYLPAFRGRTDTPEPIQVAEIAALEWADAHALNRRQVRVDAAPLPKTPAPGDSLTLTAYAEAARLAIHLLAEEYTVQGRCEAVAAGESSRNLRWRVDSVERCAYASDLA